VEIAPSPSILLSGMAGSRLPVAIAHGEGRAQFASMEEERACAAAGLIALRYIDGHGAPAVRYPDNPNGASGAIAALTTPDGRVTITMPHPERVYAQYKTPGIRTRPAQMPDGCGCSATPACG